MKHSLTLLSIFAVFGVISGRANDVLPPRFDFDRYSTMLKNSPFTIATAIALPAATPDFAKDLYVANAAHLPEGDMVAIASISDQNLKKYLTTKGPVDGYGIASIEWSDRVGATKVTISKDGNFATLTFNQALLAKTPFNGAQTPRPLRNGVPSVPRQTLTGGMIQRNPKATAIATPGPGSSDAQGSVDQGQNLAPILKPNAEPPSPGSIDAIEIELRKRTSNKPPQNR